MFRTPKHWIVLAAVLCTSASLHAQNLIRNGGFAQSAARIGDGSIPPNVVSNWSAAYGTPQIKVGDGCRDTGFIAMWGNKAVGEAVMQDVSLKKGTTYEISLCARYRQGPMPSAHVDLRLSTSRLSNPSCPTAVCESIPGPRNLTSTAWTPYRVRFTPSRDASILTISTSNDSSVNDGAQVSWSDIDDVEITPANSLVPVNNAGAPGSVPDQYIVVFKSGTPLRDVVLAEERVRGLGGTVLFHYPSLPGFAAKLPPPALESMRSDARVAFIDQDQRVKADYSTQLNPPKGLDRTDQRLLTSPNQNKYTYTEDGTGVSVYVIDTGIRTSHTDFGGRASGAFTAVNDGNGMSDCGSGGTGHGTHVAGTIGGQIYGIAKKVTLDAVRVLDCSGNGTEADVIAGVDWVTLHHSGPSVANMSLGANVALPALETAISNSIAAPSNVTYVVSAGNGGADACGYSPARLPAAITVGAIDPTNDTRPVFSNWGTCLDLFAPGVNIASAGNASDTAGPVLKNGTSMAAPHVTGVAALYLQHHQTATPADVWGAVSAIHFNDDVSTTPGWPGVINRGNGSPNELLHWGALSDGYDDGDPHLTTVDGVHYNFQGAGEFVLLRGGGVEIQTRQTPVATTFRPGPDPYDGVASCVSLNTAVAVRVGAHRVTYEPNLSGVPDPSGMQLRIDGVVTPLSAGGIALLGGGRVIQSPAGAGVEIDFPEGTILTAIPNWWASQGKWYLNVHVNRTRATDGLMGAIAQGSWLPALPNGQSLGPMPTSLHQRFVDLNQTFADAWRVTPSTSLFDYASGTSTATFTLRGWPSETGECVLPQTQPAKPGDAATAQKACAEVRGEKSRADCVFDVAVTGETSFARAYLVRQRLQTGGTVTTLVSDKATSLQGTPVTFTASVTGMAADMTGVPAGAVQFFVDGNRAGEPVRLDAVGHAGWATSALPLNTHHITASYVPAAGTAYLPSSSASVDVAIVRDWTK